MVIAMIGASAPCAEAAHNSQRDPAAGKYARHDLARGFENAYIYFECLMEV